MNSTASHSRREPEAILRELSGVIEGSQSALLASKPQELELLICLQRTLCEELEASLRTYASCIPPGVHSKLAPTPLVRSALKAREQNRLFSALLRRVRHNLDVIRNTLIGP